MNGSTRVVGRRKQNHLTVFVVYVKSTVFVTLPWTVTVAVCVPNFSCHASMVYVPGGRFLRVNLPSSPVVEKNGYGKTPANACIQPCTLHSNGSMTSRVVKVRSVVMPAAGWLMLNGRLFFPIALMLWSSGSLFTIRSG